MKAIKAYLSISKQFLDGKSFCLQKIDELFSEFNEDVDVNTFKGGSYTYPADIIGEDTNIVFTYIPHAGETVGKGVASEIQWARETGIPVIAIVDTFAPMIVRGTANHDLDDWRNYAILQFSKFIVPPGGKPELHNEITIKSLLANKGIALTRDKKSDWRRTLLI